MDSSAHPQDDHLRIFEKYITEKCATRLHEIHQTTQPKSHNGVDVDMVAVGEISELTVQKLLNNPSTMLPFLQKALETVYTDMFPDDLRPFLHPRVCHFPTFAKWCKPNISVLRSTDIGKMISIMATVTRTGSVILREASREMMCRRCKHTFEVQSDVAQRGRLEMPVRCPSDGEKSCFSTSFAPVEDAALPECREYQEIKLQEKVQHLHVGSVPRSIMCILVDDLADSVKPGDDVLVHGVVHLQWGGPLIPGKRLELELMIVAEHVQTNNERKSFLQVSQVAVDAFEKHWSHSKEPRAQLAARDVILRSVCPQIYGMYIVKLIIAMTLIGGVEHSDHSGSRIRGESHLLMVGDPGTAKSQFLRYCAKLSPRSVLTTGIGTTSAGLTVTAVREAGTGEWILDAGALVLADGGICCIDEFDGIKSHDRGAIHEAMQQQTLSVAKAGLVCTLNTRCTVMAAVNPKTGKIATEIGTMEEDADGMESEGNLPITVGIAAPLLSRFDVILTLVDQHDEDWDWQLCSFILDGYTDDGQLSKQVRRNRNRTRSSQSALPTWSFDRLRDYFYHVKTNLKPELSSDAMKLLTTYYQKERAHSRRNAARTTVRLLEALVRLTQAHARLMFRETANAMDAAFAIAAVEASSVAQTVVGGVGALHAPFPDDPAETFDEFARCMLAKLGLEDEGINFYDNRPPESDSSFNDDVISPGVFSSLDPGDVVVNADKDGAKNKDSHDDDDDFYNGNDNDPNANNNNNNDIDNDGDNDENGDNNDDDNNDDDNNDDEGNENSDGDDCEGDDGDDCEGNDGDDCEGDNDDDDDDDDVGNMNSLVPRRPTPPTSRRTSQATNSQHSTRRSDDAGESLNSFIVDDDVIENSTPSQPARQSQAPSQTQERNIFQSQTRSQPRHMPSQLPPALELRMQPRSQSRSQTHPRPQINSGQQTPAPEQLPAPDSQRAVQIPPLNPAPQDEDEEGGDFDDELAKLDEEVDAMIASSAVDDMQN